VSASQPPAEPARRLPGAIVALAGGVGGAKLAHGLALAAPEAELAVIVNTGDDFSLHGLTICPDLDTVMYTLAGLANPATGWGVAGESWQALAMLERYGAETWFRLGDRDLATHVARSARLRAGGSLSAVTADLARALGIRAQLLPMSDDPVPTLVDTDEGELAFQDYFVRRRCEPVLRGLRFAGVEQARPSPAARAALATAEVVVLCPSNPFVSLDPILALHGRALAEWRGRHGRVVAVSPIIAGQAVKGPAAKMFRELGVEPSALAVAEHYRGLLDGFVLDARDAQQAGAVEALGLRALVTDTLMTSDNDRRRLAAEVLALAHALGAASAAARGGEVEGAPSARPDP
jgi:LPPG:FO 2-phospho-L-lactate transferase